MLLLASLGELGSYKVGSRNLGNHWIANSGGKHQKREKVFFIFRGQFFHSYNVSNEPSESITQLTFTCLKSTVETPEKGVKYVQS